MFDAATEPVAALQPDPPRAPPRAVPGRPIPPHIARVLSLLHTLIAYGQNLADTLQQHAAAPHLLRFFPFLVRTFATGDLARILARIARGLLRAAALEARLRRRAARGRDLMSTPRRPPSPRKLRAAKPAQAPALNRLPTPEEIAAEIRHRPIGAVIVDICHDLGVMPGQMDHAAWSELSLVLIGHGGSLVDLVCPGERRRRPADPAGDPTADPTGSPSAGDGFVPIAWAAIAARASPFPPWPAHNLGSVPGSVPEIGRPPPASTGPP